MLDDVSKLVLSERKSINTLTYMTLIMMSYFGPNANLLGNIKLEIWHFNRPITDIESYVFKGCLLMGVDILSLVINGIVIWHFCRVNVLEKLKDVQNNFWHLFAIAEGYLLMEQIWAKST